MGAFKSLSLTVNTKIHVSSTTLEGTLMTKVIFEFVDPEKLIQLESLAAHSAFRFVIVKA